MRAAKPGLEIHHAGGRGRLHNELDELWRVERPRVTQAVAEAAAQGDRSENAEYTYGKRRLREIDRRVRFLRNGSTAWSIVDTAADGSERVFFGAWVTLETDDGATRALSDRRAGRVRSAPGYISMDSPLARALMRKSLDDEVTVEVPGGTAHLHRS